MKHVGDSIQAFVSGELEAGRCKLVEDHLSVCPQCRRQMEEARTLWDQLGAADNISDSGTTIWPEVRSRTLGAGERTREWFFGNGPWTRAGLVTTALAAGLVCGILIPGGQAPGTSDSGDEDSAWLVDSTWLSGTTWLSGDGNQGLDVFILGTDSGEMENGS